MFIYLCKDGKYWLKAMMLSMCLALCGTLALPAASTLAGGTPPAPTGPGGKFAPRPAPTPTNDDKKDKEKGSSSQRGSTLEFKGPSGAKILAGSNLSRQTFKPWLSRTLPWDGNWGAFNDSISERLGGTCVLDDKDQKNWNSFMSEKQKYYDKLINEKKLAGPKLAREFRKHLKNSLGSKGQAEATARLLLGGRNSNTIKNIDSFDQLYQLQATSPQLAACNRSNDVLAAWWRGFLPNPLNIFKYPGRFIAQLFFFLPALVGYAVFQIVAPFAFGLALNTPHSERGDTLFHSFAVTAASGAISSSKPKKLVTSGNNRNTYSENMGDLAPQMDCKTTVVETNRGTAAQRGKDYSGNADAQLGFSCNNLKQKEQDSIWIQMANSLRSALSAVYGIIVIAVALIYLVRRNSQSQYHIKVILPRLFLAVIMTMAAPYFIGMVITFSNWTVQAIFSSFPGTVPQQVMSSIVTLTATNTIDGFSIIGVFIAMAIPTFMLLWVDAIMIYLLFVAVGKQLVLIALIIMAPIACVAFIFRDHGKNIFAYWIKGLFAVAGLPVMMGAVLAGGMILARAFWNPENSMGFGVGVNFSLADIAGRYIAAIVLAATFFMLCKCVGSARAWVTGNRAGMMGKIGGKATALGGMVAGAGIGAGLTAFGVPMGAAIGSAIGSAGKKAGGKMAGGGGGMGGSLSKFVPDSSAGTLKGASSKRAGGDASVPGQSFLEKGLRSIERQRYNNPRRPKPKADDDKDDKPDDSTTDTSADENTTPSGGGSAGAEGGTGGTPAGGSGSGGTDGVLLGPDGNPISSSDHKADGASVRPASATDVSEPLPVHGPQPPRTLREQGKDMVKSAFWAHMERQGFDKQETMQKINAFRHGEAAQALKRTKGARAVGKIGRGIRSLGKGGGAAGRVLFTGQVHTGDNLSSGKQAVNAVATAGAIVANPAAAAYHGVRLLSRLRS